MPKQLGAFNCNYSWINADWFWCMRNAYKTVLQVNKEKWTLNTFFLAFQTGGCKIGVFLTYFLSHLASWVLVIVNLDRVVTVTAPLWAKKLFQPRYHLIALAITTTVLCVFDLHTFFMIEPYNAGSDNGSANGTGFQVCSIIEEHWEGKYPDFLMWSDFVLLSFLPFVIIVICNSVILVYMYRAQKGSSFRRATSSVTVMLVVVSVTFLITTTPLVLYYILYDTIIANHQNDPVGLSISIALVGNTILVLLCYSNNAVNFALYYLCGSRFRYALKQLINVNWKRRDSSRSSSRSQGHNMTSVWLYMYNKLVWASNW